MARKAEAWNEYKEAAIVKMIVDVLPQVAAEVAAPIAQTKKIKIVSTGAGDVGVSKLTNEILNIMVTIPKVVAELSGADMNKLFERNHIA